MIRTGTLAMSAAAALLLAATTAGLLRAPAHAAEQSSEVTQPAQPAAANANANANANAAAGQGAGAQKSSEYAIKNGRVGVGIFHGYLFYGESCLRCHGPDGYGSSYAPSLVDALKTLSKHDFEDVVINGKQDVSTSSQLVMPAFGTVADVVLHLNDIYGYLKAESEGKIGRGRPKQLNG